MLVITQDPERRCRTFAEDARMAWPVLWDESTVCPASEPAGVICSDGTWEGLTPGATYTPSEVVTPLQHWERRAELRAVGALDICVDSLG